MNKKGALAFELIFGLIILFALGILYIIYNQVVTVHIQPSVENIIPDSYGGKAAIVTQNNDYLSFWNIVPFIIVILIVMFLIMSAIRKNNGNGIP